MAEVLTFGNFEVGKDSIYEIGGGVITEMAVALGHTLSDSPDADNLRGLVGAAGPNRHLQENIGDVRERLQQGLGGRDPIEASRDWAERSDLLGEVRRPFIEPGDMPDKVDVALVTGGVLNWMRRRSGLLTTVEADETLLVAGEILMSEGMTQVDYLEQVVLPEAQEAGHNARVIRVEAEGPDAKISGSDVMEAAALQFVGDETVAVVGNAGNWVQNAGQFRSAMRKFNPDFDQGNDRQLFVVSDSFPLGVTGEEPTATHQNPITALAIMARNARTLVQHAS